LLEHLEGESPLVQEAVRESLADFNFPAYLAAFDKMSEPTRLKTGGLVAKVDVRAPQCLEQELRSEATFRQLRACSIIRLLHLEPMLEGVLHDLLAEGDQAVRVEAAEMLSRCPTEATRQALREAVLDRNVRVREMAEESLRRVAGHPVSSTESSSSSSSENSSPADDLSLRS
ncbi:MAG: HEAT repeat domain-containing protein, partial [Pirellulaceae bacterium]